MGKATLASFLTVLLTIAWYAVAVFLALALCFAALSPFIDTSGGELGIPVSFSVDPATHRITAPSLGIDHAQIEKASGTLRVPIRRGAFVTTNAILLAVALWVIGQLRALFRTLRDGQPFVPANATRVRRIAWAVILGELARSTIVFVGSSNMMHTFTAEGLRFDARLDLTLFAIVKGLIILAIAEVFRKGTRLDEEQSLT